MTVQPTPVQLTSTITVRLLDRMGSDQHSIGAMKVLDHIPLPAVNDAARLWSLMRKRHASPFEHSAALFFIHCPAFVWWEMVRHRWMSVDCPDWSFNLESGRWHELQPVFWVPRRGRKMVPVAGFKPMEPEFKECPEDASYQLILDNLQHAYSVCWHQYLTLLALGVACEVARSVLGFGIYYQGWVTVHGVRNLLHFLSLRTHEPKAAFVSYPQAEIEEVAHVFERFLAEGWPLTHAAFCEVGRVAP